MCDQFFSQWELFPTTLQLEEWHASYKSTPHYSNKALAFLKTMFNWAIRHGHYLGPNPTLGIKQHRTFSRERVMTSREVGLLLACLDMMPVKMATLRPFC